MISLLREHELLLSFCNTFLISHQDPKKVNTNKHIPSCKRQISIINKSLGTLPSALCSQYPDFLVS